MENIKDFIQPELLILVPVLYIIGTAIKKTKLINDKYIPLILGAIGIIMACLYVIPMCGFSAMCIFTSITQGVLVAGGSVYVNEVITQTKK